MIRRSGLATLLAGIVAMLSVQMAAAHADFVSSDPTPGGVIPSPPARVTITFTEDVARGTDISVIGPSGQVASTGETTRSGAQASVAVRSMGSGIYTVNWTSVSADDGDEDSGSFEFGVGAPGTVIPRAMPQSGTGLAAGPGAAWQAGAIALAALLLGGVLLRGRARPTAVGAYPERG